MEQINKRYYNNHAWYHSNISSKSRTINQGQNMHVNDTAKI